MWIVVGVFVVLVWIVCEIGFEGLVEKIVFLVLVWVKVMKNFC